MKEKTLVSGVSNVPQSRHPERSASQIYRVTQRSWRAVEGPRRCLSYSYCSELLIRRSPHRQELTSISLGLGMEEDYSAPVLRLRWWKDPSSMDKISTAEVLRFRATSAVSRDKSVRRSAQDDDFERILTKNIVNKHSSHADSK
jgi:hypothetical protein